MAQGSLRCPKCQKTLEEGHIPDIGYGQATASAWAPGSPDRLRFFGGIRLKKKELIPFSAYRCSSCGFVELYARDT